MDGMYTLVALAIAAGSMVLLLLGTMAAVKSFYKVPKADEALVKTGGKAPVVSTGGGLWVVPMFHEIARVSLQAIRVPIDRTGQDAVPSKDMIPAEIKGEMFVQISPQDEKAIVLAVQSLGTASPDQMPDLVRQKIDSQVTDALRTAAFQKTFIELNSEKKQFADMVIQLLQEDLTKLGLTLTAVSVTHVSQGPFTEDTGDVIAAQGRRNVAETVEKNRQETNLITRNAEIKVQQQDMDAKEKSLELDLRLAQKQADQSRAVEEYEAEQATETKKAVLAQSQAEAEAQAAQERAIAEAQAREAELSAKADIARVEQVTIAQAKANAAQKAEEEMAAADIAEAEADRQVREEAALRKKREAEIAKAKAVEEAEIAKDKAVKVAAEERQQAIEVAAQMRQQATETAEVERQKAVAKVRAEEAAARAEQADAEAGQRKAEESVITVQETAKADRQRQVVEIQAREGAAKDKIAADRDAYIEAKRAEGERDAAMKRAEAIRVEAEGRANAKKAVADGDAEAIKIQAAAYAADVKARADADAEAADKQASAKIKLAQATLKEGEAAAEAERLMVEARNQVANELLVRDVALAVIEQAPDVVRELMAPVAAVTHDVKVLQINGLGGGEGSDSTVGTVMGTGLALTGLLPHVREFITAAANNEDVKDIASTVTSVATSALSQGAKAIRAADEGAGEAGQEGSITA